MIQHFHFGYLSGKNKNTNLKKYIHPVFLSALFTIAKIWKQPKCLSTNEWIEKMWYIYIYNGIPLSHVQTSTQLHSSHTLAK